MSSKPLSQAQLQALIAGVPIYCANTTFSVAGQTFTAPQVVTFLTGVLNAGAAVTATKAAWTAAIQTLEKNNAGDGAIAKELRDSIALMFSNAPTTLSDLAIAPRKPPKPLTTEARAAANAKMKATRAARGIMSKKQKALITGNVTGVNITPVTAGSGSASAGTATIAPSTGTPVASNGAAAAAVAATTHG